MDGWRNIDKIPQLKWGLLATSQAILNETELAIRILSILTRITEAYPSRDSENAVIRPLPRIKRLLSEQTCLPHIVQLLLTFDPIIIEKVANLLDLIVQDNPVLPRLYLTGVFFFIVMYTGSNVLSISRFLKYTHSKQAFRSVDESSSNSTSEILKHSILSPILPEAMICYLENHGDEKFAQIFLGEFDTPEVIWSNEMRRYMIEKIAGHLADFTPRLQSNTRALYQYCAIPIIIYKQLESELFCNIFYLKHLCDVVKFPNWPISDPIQLLKDCLLTWKNELEKKPPQMSRDEALAILDLKSDDSVNEVKIRKTYFKLAQKYHPDKNKDGREMFEKVNKAYEYLCNSSKLKDGPDPTNIILLVKTQIILYEYFSELLMPYKYAGYNMLLKTIKTETSDEQLFSKKYDLLSCSTHLVYQTIRCSALNAEELRRENGINLLNESFNRCVAVLGKLSKNESEMSVLVCLYSAKIYNVAAQFEECRERFLEIKSLIQDLSRCLNFKFLTNLCISICETFSAFAKYDERLQDAIYKSGTIYHLLYYMFYYDFTLDESGVERNTTTNQQEVANNLARGCLNALISLSSNHFVGRILVSLLTPYFFKKLSSNETFLKLLNSNTENPYLIWNNTTRAELNGFLEEQREKIYKKGELDDLDYGENFKYTSIDNELMIGDLYVRVYNEQPTFALENPKKFAADLLDFIGSHAQYMYSACVNNDSQSSTIAETVSKKASNVEKALESLRNVIRNNEGVEIICIGYFKLLFSLLRLNNYERIQNMTLEILLLVTTNKECVNDIAQAEVIVNLLITLNSTHSTTQLAAMDTLYELCSNTKIVKDTVSTGGILYLLNIFANNNLAQVRQKSAELFGKMMSDKLTGPKVRLDLQRFLPPLFMDAMKDSPEAAVLTFEGTYENPELIWNDETRKLIAEKIKTMCASHYEAQQKNIEHKWSLNEELANVGVDSSASSTSTLYSGNTSNEIVVCGVFLRLFIANPGWVLRKPKEFLTDLFERWSEMCNRKAQEGEVLEQLTQSLVQLFSAQPGLLDYVPSMGCLPQVSQALSSKKSAINGSALQVLNQLVNNDACLKSMASNDWMTPIKQAIQNRPDLIFHAADSLGKIFSCELVIDEFVGQACRCDLISLLLNVLNSNLNKVEKPTSVKALIVKALKLMLNSIQHAEKVSLMLTVQTPMTY
jgi:DnaJ family protein C protein 13